MSEESMLEDMKTDAVDSLLDPRLMLVLGLDREAVGFVTVAKGRREPRDP